MARLGSGQSGMSEAVRRQRLTLFGNNEIDVEGKSTMSLLLDEVLFDSLTEVNSLIRVQGHPSVFCLPNCKHSSLVTGQLLLLRVLHRCYIPKHHYNDPFGDKKGKLENLGEYLDERNLHLHLDNKTNARNVTLQMQNRCAD